MTCIKTGAVVLIECYDLVFHADLFQVDNAVVVRANGPLERGRNAFSFTEYKDKFCDSHKVSHKLTGDQAGNEFWRSDLGIFVVPQARLAELGV